MLPLRHARLVAALLVFGAATACVTQPPDLPEADTIAASETGDDRALPDPDSGGAWESTGTLDDETGGSESGGQAPPAQEPPSNDECDTFAQDCAPGEKCMPVSTDGGSSWNATQCRPVAMAPAQVGDPCTVQDAGNSGLDDCDVGAMCWGVDPNSLTGTCVALCAGSEGDPVCDDPATACVVDSAGALAACLPTCTPLDETGCGAGQGCYLVGELFACVPASTMAGQAGDECEAINACVPGTMCVGADAVPGCAGAVGCCADLCDVATGMCPAEQSCVPIFGGMAPPEWNDVGVCAVPQ